MPVTLGEAARRLGFRDNREVKGIVKFLGIPLTRVGTANMLLMEDHDFELIRKESRARRCDTN